MRDSYLPCSVHCVLLYVKVLLLRLILPLSSNTYTPGGQEGQRGAAFVRGICVLR